MQELIRPQIYNYESIRQFIHPWIENFDSYLQSANYKWTQSDNAHDHPGSWNQKDFIKELIYTILPVDENTTTGIINQDCYQKN